jgi:hypothetical protein
MLMIIHQQIPPFQPSSLRLIQRWNQTPVSGSSRIGITPPVQAHHALEDSHTCRTGALGYKMLPHLRRPFLAGDIPSGHASVFHFLDIFALGCGLEALAGLHKGDPLWIIGAYVAGAVGFHLLGTKWPLIEEKLGPRIAFLLRPTP